MKKFGKLLLSVLCIAMVLIMGCKKSTSSTGENSGPTVTDFDGNVYHLVTIGSQVWTVENLRVKHYRNGDPIQAGKLDQASIVDTSGTFWAYENSSGYIPDYGLLYNWYAVMDSRSIAPPGFHIPGDAEYGVLVNGLGGDYFALPWGDTVTGGKLKETGNDHWGIPGDPRTNVGATNSSKWTGRPGGILYQGNFVDIRGYGAWWTTTTLTGVQKDEAYELVLAGVDKKASRGVNLKPSGLSARCIKD